MRAALDRFAVRAGSSAPRRQTVSDARRKTPEREPDSASSLLRTEPRAGESGVLRRHRMHSSWASYRRRHLLADLLARWSN